MQKFNIMRKFLLLVIFIASGFVFESCCVYKKNPDKLSLSSKLPSPQVIIYKTKGDYSRLVPVILSKDKKSVISYPDIKDVKRGDSYTYPTSLQKGYWLDNRGISEDVAFIRLTYKEYAALPRTPLAEELYGMILSRNPIKKMYACGLRHTFTNLEEELNKALLSGDLSAYTRLK